MTRTGRIASGGAVPNPIANYDNCQTSCQLEAGSYDDEYDKYHIDLNSPTGNDGFTVDVSAYIWFAEDLGEEGFGIGGRTATAT